VASRRRWDVQQATAFFAYGAVAVAVAGAALQSMGTVRHWHEVRDVQAALAAEVLADAAPDDVVMSADSGAMHYLTGNPAVVTPNDPLSTIEEAMRAYGVRWLVLESEQIVPALEPVLLGEHRPGWLSAPVAVVPGAAAPVATAGTTPAPFPLGAVYAVCLSAADTRCDR
jgi:hypothetical protein